MHVIELTEFAFVVTLGERNFLFLLSLKLNNVGCKYTIAKQSNNVILTICSIFKPIFRVISFIWTYHTNTCLQLMRIDTMALWFLVSFASACVDARQYAAKPALMWEHEKRFDFHFNISRKFQSATEKLLKQLSVQWILNGIETKKAPKPKTPYILIISNQKVIKMFAKFIPRSLMIKLILWTCSSVNNFIHRYSVQFLQNICRPIHIIHITFEIWKKPF